MTTTGAQPMMISILRDAQVHPFTREFAKPYFQHWNRMRYVLTTGWGTRDRQLELLLAELGHALDFKTWHSLAQQGLDDEQAVELVVGMVRSLVDA